MKNWISIIIMFLLVIPFEIVYSLNPQLYYKSIYVYSDSRDFQLIYSKLGDVMLLDSSIHYIKSIDSKNDLSSADILIYIANDLDLPTKRSLDIISEWFRQGGKLFLTLEPRSEAEAFKINRVLSALDAGFKVSYVGVERNISFTFRLFYEIKEYKFDSRLVGRKLEFSSSSEIIINTDHIGDNGNLVTLGGDDPVVICQYIPVYSDLFTWYYSKAMAIRMNVDELSRTDDVDLLLGELLSWGISPYLNPNYVSLVLTIVVGLSAIVGYTMVNIYEKFSKNV